MLVKDQGVASWRPSISLNSRQLLGDEEEEAQSGKN